MKFINCISMNVVKTFRSSHTLQEEHPCQKSGKKVIANSSKMLPNTRCFRNICVENASNKYVTVLF